MFLPFYELWYIKGNVTMQKEDTLIGLISICDEFVDIPCQCFINLSHWKNLCAVIVMIFLLPHQALLSLGYLCSSDIFALINYVGFATWVTTRFNHN